MKEFKKKLFVAIFALLFVSFSSVYVFATWSGTISATLPRFGGSVDNFTYITKTSSSSTFSVYGVAETNALDPYVSLVNSNGESRSGWCKLQNGLTNSVYDNKGTANYMYRTRARSHFAEPNITSVSYQFDPK